MLNGLLALPKRLGDRLTSGRAASDSLLDSTESSAPLAFVGLVEDDIELVDLESFSSRLLGDGDLETFGEFHER